jgi:beta-lactamase regulating signal transducer with metallopeptidase domain
MTMLAITELLSRPALLSAFLLMLAIQGTLVVFAAAVATRQIPNTSAATRAGIWAAAFLCLCLLPIVSTAAPLVELPLFVAEAALVPAGWAFPSPLLLGATLAAVALGGFVYRLGRFGVAVAAVAALTRRGTELPQSDAAQLARRVVAELGIRRSVRVLFAGDLASPANWGCWRPVILLPAAAVDWPAERLRVVLVHELAHIRRADYAVHVLIELAAALHWFNPRVDWAAARSREEQESACDDEVLRDGTRPAPYASHLLHFAHLFPARQALARCALLVANPGSLRSRIRHLLDPHAARGPSARGTVLAVVSALAILTFASGRVALWTCAPESGPDANAQQLSQLQP